MFDFIARENPEYVDALYREYRRDPRAVDERWAFVFSAYELGLAHGAGGATGPEVGNLVHAYRDRGHLIADLDPLGSSPRQHPLLRLEEFGIREADLRVDECEGFRGWGRVTLRELLAALRDTYCRTLGVEYMGIPDKERRDPLQDRMEPSRNHPALSPDQRRRILERLIAAEGFEQFLHAKYVTATRFSLEGGEPLMPLLDTVVEEAGGLDAQELVLDMPHRGRLNVLAHVRGKPYEMLLAEFEGSFLQYHLGDSHDVEPAGGRLPIVGRRPLEPVRSRLEGEGYSYGTYEISPERAAFYRERLSPTLRRTPEARLDFVSEGRHYVRRERRNSPEYMREVEQLALRQDGERTMANTCRVVACIPIYTLGEGKIVEHALEQYRKQITNGSVKPEEFEVLLFLNHPKDKLTDIHIAPGAEERVRTGHPESYDTKEVIRQYRARYPELNIHVIEKEFATRPNWGWIIKYAYDAAALRAQARKHPVDNDVIILANDVDVRDTSGTYLRQLIETFDKNKKDVGAGKTPRIDGVVGRIDHDTTTYRTWPNFFAVTRFEQFLDAQNRRGYPGRQPHTLPEAEGDGYALRVRRRGEKHTVTQGRNTALRASAYCAIGGANTETDVGADTELGRMVTFARRGVMEKTLQADEYTLTYSSVMWLETDPRRELGMYRKGEPVARAWSEWEAMNVYGKSFCEQIAGETEELNTGRLEKEFKEILKKWGLSANAPSVERALAWLGLAKKDEATGEYIYKDYEIVPDAEGEPMIEITNLDHLRQHIARWKPKRERIVSAKSRAR